MNPPANSLFRRSVIQAAIMAVALPASTWAAPLPLSSAPAIGSFKLPAPNVIVSVDDSGSMGASGMAALRNALQQTFSDTNVPDGSIRLAWQAMTGCYTIPSTSAASTSCKNLNGMRELDAPHRQNFMNWVSTLVVQGNTPSHRMLRNAGEYLRKPIDVDSAWASKPGVTRDPVLSCRRSYNLFMTDGGWNDLTLPADNTIGDVDNTARTLPDGTGYDITSDNTRIFRSGVTGPWLGTTLSTTLSDMAFYYWATDLQPGIANEVPPKIKSPGPSTFTFGATSKAIPQYWNPRNDPATWQHMSLYTVGFNAAANWTVTPKFGPDTWTDHAVTHDYSKLVLGLANWPNPITGSENNQRITELWHMALSSRGKYIPAPDASSLVTAFRDILNEIIVDNSRPVTSLAASASSLRRDSALYAAGYDAANWTGQVAAYAVTAGTGAVSSSGVWGTVPATPPNPARPMSTADVMDGPSFNLNNRVVLSAQDTGAGPTGTFWKWALLSPAKQVELNSNGASVDARGQERLDFIRGDRSQEGVTPPPVAGVPGNVFRVRGSRHGDIVNSEVWFTSGLPDTPYINNGYATFRTSNSARRSMLYVGANDGMLHGFDTADGSEKIAYIPDGLHAALGGLSNVNYTHRYYVDGSPFTADVYIGSTWKTFLAGFPGLGGRGYFVLDVTDPSGFGTLSASQTVVLDTTATSDPDIGHIVSQPVVDQTDPKLALQLTRMNNGRWALVTGNGVNSISEKAVLLIQYVDGGRELLKIVADSAGGNGNGNGLAAPRLVDINGDHIPDVAYAGDLRGNLWKFDLTDPSAANWKVSFGGTPFYVAKDGLGNRQPITTTPGWLFHPDGGLMVSVGTGRNITDADRVASATETLYGIYDPTKISVSATTNAATGSSTIALDGTNNAVTDARASLVEQTISTNATATTDTGSSLWTVSSNPVPYSGAGARRGWFIDLPITGERAYKSMKWVRGRLFSIPSGVPSVGGDPNLETCVPTTSAGASFLTIVNIINGSPPNHAVFLYGTPPVGSTEVPSRLSDSTNGNSVYLKTVDSSGDLKCGSTGGICPTVLGVSPVPLRPTWRQAQ